MTTIIIYGIPNWVGPRAIDHLMDNLKDSVQQPASEVAVFFPADLCPAGLGEEIICFVWVSQEVELTTALRQRITELVLLTLHSFAVNHMRKCQRAQVVVRRFNPETDGFATCDPRLPFQPQR